MSVMAPTALLVSQAVRREQQALDLERAAMGTELHGAALALLQVATQERQAAEKAIDEHIAGQAKAIEQLQDRLQNWRRR